jgi:hypothetical protein
MILLKQREGTEHICTEPSIQVGFFLTARLHKAARIRVPRDLCPGKCLGAYRVYEEEDNKAGWVVRDRNGENARKGQLLGDGD